MSVSHLEVADRYVGGSCYCVVHPLLFFVAQNSVWIAAQEQETNNSRLLRGELWFLFVFYFDPDERTILGREYYE